MTGFVPDPGQSATTSVGNAVGAAVGGVLSASAIAQASAGVQQLSAAAKSGGFAISEEGADQYIKVFDEFETNLAIMQDNLVNAGQAPQLGTSPYAKQVASEVQLIASGDAQSYETALNSLATIVSQARAAFVQAKSNYAQMEDEAVQTFRGVQA